MLQSIPVTQTILLLIAEIDEFKGSWKALNLLAVERLAALRKVATLHDGQPDWEAWLLFFFRALQRQKNRLQVKLEREKIFSAALPVLAVQILELATDRGRVTTQEIVLVTNESRSTIKARLNQLVAAGLLVRYGQGRSTWYGLA